MRRASSQRSTLWCLTYVVCFAFVVFFVLSETVDLDVSVSGKPLSQLTVDEDDLRRKCPPSSLLTAIRLDGELIVMSERVPAVPQVGSVQSQHDRIALPRALLGEAAPSA